MTAWIVTLLAALLGLSEPAPDCNADPSHPTCEASADDGANAEDEGAKRKAVRAENDISNGF